MKTVSKKYIAVPPTSKGGTYTLAIRSVHHTPLMAGLPTLDSAQETVNRMNTEPLYRWFVLSAHWLGIKP